MILLLLVASNVFLLNLENIVPGIDIRTTIICYITVALLNFFLIKILVSQFFQTPIRNLEYAIKSFLVGDTDEVEERLQKTLNGNLNYSILFFKKTLNTLKNIKEEFIHGRAIKWEVGIAKEIQEKMLDKKITPVPSFEMIFKSKPAGEIGGDSFDVIKTDDNYYIYVWDATGHGVGAGLIMTMVNSLVAGFSEVYESGAKILANTNKILKPRVKANLLMSLLLVRWNEKEKRLFMSGAGHEYLMIYKQKNKKTFRIKSGGVALGMIKDISKLVKEVEIKVEPWDIIVLYSDGVTEAINKPQRDGSEMLFGEDRLEKAIQDAPNIPNGDYKTARSVFNNITMSLSAFMGYKPVQLDDVTLWVIQYKTHDYDQKNDFPETLSDSNITEWKW